MIFTILFSDGTLSIIDSFFPHLPCYKCSSQDCTIKVWETMQGKLIRELKVNACLCIVYIVSPHVLLLNGIGVIVVLKINWLNTKCLEILLQHL